MCRLCLIDREIDGYMLLPKTFAQTLNKNKRKENDFYCTV